MAGGSTRRRSMADYSVAAHARGVNAGDARMERYHEYVGRHRVERRVWPGAAFIVEALLLLVFLAGSLAVLMNLNAAADAAGEQSADLMGAMALASNVAEEFAADPVALEEAYGADAMADQWLSEPVGEIVSGESALLADCQFSTEATAGGSLHYLTIEVLKVRVLTDPSQMLDEGIVAGGSGDVCFQHWDDEPVYTLETARYVPASDARAAADGATAGAAPGVAATDSPSQAEGEVSHG